MLIATLIEKKWLFRRLNVVTPEGVFEVAYDGTGAGYESVLIDGNLAVKTISYLWYVPEFNFQIGSLPANIKVRISWKLVISFFILEVDGHQLYSEE